MNIKSNIEQDLYTNLLENQAKMSDSNGSPAEQVKEVIKKEATEGSEGLQKEQLGILSNYQVDLSLKETAQRQLRNGFLDVTV